MDIVLIILGVLGFGAIVIAAYVFTVAARNYVSNESHPDRMPNAQDPAGAFVERRPVDRRRSTPASFPITVNSVMIARDRRSQPDRRLTPSPG
jgi:hypothetical protein